MPDNPQLFIEDGLLDTISRSLQQMQKGMEKLQSLNKNMDTLEDDDFVAWVTNPSSDLTTQLDLALQFKDFMKMFGPHAIQFLKNVEEIRKEVDLSKRHISFFNSAMKNITSTKDQVETVTIANDEHKPPMSKVENVSKIDRHCSKTQPASISSSVLKSTTSSSPKNLLQKKSIENSSVQGTNSKSIKLDNSESGIEIAPRSGLQCSSTQSSSSAPSVLKSTTSIPANISSQKRKIEKSPVEETNSNATRLDDPLSRIGIMYKSYLQSSKIQPVSSSSPVMKTPSNSTKSLLQKRKVENSPMEVTNSKATEVDDPMSRIGILFRSDLQSSRTRPISIPPQVVKSTPSVSAKVILQKRKVENNPMQETNSQTEKRETPISKNENGSICGLQFSSSQRSSFIPQVGGDLRTTTSVSENGLIQRRMIENSLISPIDKKLPSSQPTSIVPLDMRPIPSSFATNVLQKKKIENWSVEETNPMTKVENVSKSGLQCSSIQRASFIPLTYFDPTTTLSTTTHHDTVPFSCSNANQSTPNRIMKPVPKISAKKSQKRLKKSSRNRCLLCSKNGHSSESCLNYPTLMSRLEFLDKRQRCRNCIKHKIGNEPCRYAPAVCRYCKKNHIAALCDFITDSMRIEMACKETQLTHK